MKKIKITGTSLAQNLTGFATGVTASAGAALTLAATTPGDSLAHKIIITPSGSVTGNYTLTGTDADGNVLTETLATNTVSAVTSAGYFATLTSVLAPAGIGAQTVDIGFTAASVSPWNHLKEAWSPVGVGFACIKGSGSPTFGVQQEYGDGTAFDHATVAAKSASIEGAYTTPVRAIRLAWSAAGQVTLLGWY